MEELEGVIDSLYDDLTDGRILRAMANSIEFYRLRYRMEAKLIAESGMPGALKAFAHSANFVSTGLEEVIVPVPMGLTAGLFRLGYGVRNVLKIKGKPGPIKIEKQLVEPHSAWYDALFELHENTSVYKGLISADRSKGSREKQTKISPNEFGIYGVPAGIIEARRTLLKEDFFQTVKGSFDHIFRR